MIDEFSLKSLYLETYLNECQIGVATGFIVKKGTSHFLITNWHVVTCRHPSTDAPLISGISDPNILKVWFHGPQLGQWLQKEISIVDKNGKKLWKEHERGKEVDVVAIPFNVTSDVTIYDIDLSLAEFDLMIYPSEPISIIGFPQGITSVGKLPIWKTGHVASDIDIDWGGKPAFLIDATTKSGMSGSPVLAKRVSIYQTSKTNQIGNAVRFLGIYSGREIDKSGVEIGFVWKPKVISEIIER